MRVKGNLQASVPTIDVSKRIPPRLKKYVDLSLITATATDLALFTPGSRYVVTSKDLLKVLMHRPASDAQLVAVGYDFTEEAREIITQARGIMFTEGGYFGWTDEMWYSIHQTSAT